MSTVYDDEQKNTKQNKNTEWRSLLFSGKITTCRAGRQTERNNVKWQTGEDWEQEEIRRLEQSTNK